MRRCLRAFIIKICPRLSRRLSRKARAGSQKVVETIWALAFRITSCLLFAGSIRPWTSPGDQRILVLAPHPDDEAIGCGGTVILHMEAGDNICVAYMTDGRKSQAGGLTANEMATIRRREARVAADIAGVHRFEWFGFPEGAWTVDELALRLGSLICDFRPDLIYAPSRIDVHPEHHKVARALAKALAGNCTVDPIIRVYQVQVPLTPILTSLVTDTSNVASKSAALLSSYASQWGSTVRATRKWRYAANFYGKRRQAEEFWEMSAQQYLLLSRLAPTDWSATGWNTFRPLKFRSYSDPLAYVMGLSERRRLSNRIMACGDTTESLYGLDQAGKKRVNLSS